MPEMQTQTQPSRRVQAVKPNPWDGHKHPAPNPWDGCGAVHLTQSQPTRPRPSQSPLQCSPTRRSGLPGTERFISLHVGNFFGTRTTEPFEPYFSAIACHVALCRVALGLHSAPPTSCCEGQGRDLDFFRVASPSHHVLAERHARIRAVWLLVGGVEALDSNPQRRPFNSKDCKDSKHTIYV